MEKLIAAEAINTEKLLIFNVWNNQVQVNGLELVSQPERYELGVCTFVVYDRIWHRWYYYQKMELADVWSRQITDHFADNNMRTHHRYE